MQDVSISHSKGITEHGHHFSSFVLKHV